MSVLDGIVMVGALAVFVLTLYAACRVVWMIWRACVSAGKGDGPRLYCMICDIDVNVPGGWTCETYAIAIGWGLREMPFVDIDGTVTDAGVRMCPACYERDVRLRAADDTAEAIRKFMDDRDERDKWAGIGTGD